MTAEPKTRTMQIRIATADDLRWAESRIGVQFKNDVKGITAHHGDEIRAVTLYDAWSPYDCQMHLASDGTKRWMTRRYLMEAFYYPFVTAGLRRVTGLVLESNMEALALNQHLGFVIEGKLQDATPDGDLFVMGMTRRRCRFIPPEWRQK